MDSLKKQLADPHCLSSGGRCCVSAAFGVGGEGTSIISAGMPKHAPLDESSHALVKRAVLLPLEGNLFIGQTPRAPYPPRKILTQPSWKGVLRRVLRTFLASSGAPILLLCTWREREPGTL